LENPRLDWGKDDDVECWVSNTESSHIVPVDCTFKNNTQVWRCRYTPIISGKLRIQCRVNGYFVRVGTAEYMSVTVMPHPVAPVGAALHEISRREGEDGSLDTRVNASFSVYSADTGHVWPDAYRKDQDPPQELGLWYEDIYGNIVRDDLSVAMLCTADYPAWLGEEGVGDTRSDACRKQIGPVQLDPNLGRFNLPLTPEAFPSDGAYRLWCYVLQRGGLYLRVWDSAWPEDMHRPKAIPVLGVV
ncbi:hypothetical protein FOZ62_014582, partial [Perkinsus olseni]